MITPYNSFAEKRLRNARVRLGGFVCLFFILAINILDGTAATVISGAQAAEPAPYGQSSATSKQKRLWDSEALRSTEIYTDEQSQTGVGEHSSTQHGADSATQGGSTSGGVAHQGVTGQSTPSPLNTPSAGIPGGFIDKAVTEFKAITYFVVNQPLQAVVNEIVYLAGLQANLEQLPDVTVTNMQFQGSLDVVMDQLAKRFGLIWNIENGVIDIAPLKSLITRALKVDGMTEERIVELLAAAGIAARKDVIALDESTGILRIRGTPRFVAKAEAAILLGRTHNLAGGAPDDQVHVVRFGRTSRVVNPQ